MWKKWYFKHLQIESAGSITQEQKIREWIDVSRRSWEGAANERRSEWGRLQLWCNLKVMKCSLWWIRYPEPSFIPTRCILTWRKNKNICATFNGNIHVIFHFVTCKALGRFPAALAIQRISRAEGERLFPLSRGWREWLIRTLGAGRWQ